MSLVGLTNTEHILMLLSLFTRGSHATLMRMAKLNHYNFINFDKIFILLLLFPVLPFNAHAREVYIKLLKQWGGEGV